jgi:hypothetical protein
MKKYLIIGIVSILLSQLSAQDRKFGISVESQFMRVSSSFGFDRIGLNGSLGIDYQFSDKLYAGAYFMQMTDISKRDNSVYLIQGKVIDISSAKFTNLGFYAGFKLYEEEKLSISPELRIGYGMFEAKSAIRSWDDDLRSNMLTITPRIMSSYKVCDFMSAGLSAGYMLPIYTGDVKLDEYDMQNINIGVFLKLHLK